MTFIKQAACEDGHGMINKYLTIHTQQIDRAIEDELFYMLLQSIATWIFFAVVTTQIFRKREIGAILAIFFWQCHCTHMAAVFTNIYCRIFII